MVEDKTIIIKHFVDVAKQEYTGISMTQKEYDLTKSTKLKKIDEDKLKSKKVMPI